MKVISVLHDENIVNVSDSKNVYVPKLGVQFLLPELEQIIGIKFPAGVRSVHYEPDRSVYHVLKADWSVDALASPAESSVMAKIAENEAKIISYAVDVAQQSNRPSELHTYNTETKQWDITPANQAILDVKTKEEAAKNLEVEKRNAYAAESDPIFFKWQRGEATEQEWLDKIAEIKARFPKD